MFFTFNGISSRNFNLKVKSSTHLSSPSKKVEFIEIPGRTGDLVIDDGSFKNLSISIVCLLDTRETNNLAQVAKQIRNWLQSPIGYQDLVFSDGTTFKAICSNQINIEDLVNNFGQVTITFSAVEVQE